MFQKAVKCKKRTTTPVVRFACYERINVGIHTVSILRNAA